MTTSRFPRLSILLLLLAFAVQGSQAVAQNPRSPSDTVREFYKAMREKRFREAFALSIYKPAIDGLSKPEYDDLVPDFEKTALAVTQKIPADLQITGEQISGNMATVFMKILDTDDKEQLEQATLIKTDTGWILGDLENQELVKKAGKKFFFNARIDAHHNDVQDMLTRISLAQVVYSQQHNGLFADLPALIAAGLVPKDVEGTESTGYRFKIFLGAGAKTWSATAEPVHYGRTGRLSFALDATGVRNGDNGGKPLAAAKKK